ncbi:MAG: phosphoribosylformylglycinamidine synthase subunit PurQ [Dissulfuribacterales bacterium]
MLFGYGLNCDIETALALAGASPVRVHINSVIDGSVNLNDFQIMVFVGGFSWGGRSWRRGDPGGAPADRRFPYNPNGSLNNIAGICDPTGRIFGLMPHPDAFNHPSNHPDRTRAREDLRHGRISPDALPITRVAMFKKRGWVFVLMPVIRLAEHFHILFDYFRQVLLNWG